ncbi:hypothetical protein, partial [Bordetella pertussis]|uniref:hypothetical protein n=1 Tax=Bordetella pertussis TaxID=520 RepID=UPI000AEBD8D8
AAPPRAEARPLAGLWAPALLLALSGTAALGVAVLALAVTLALARAAPLFVQGEQYSPWLAWLAVLLLVGAAPFLMGGTLPVLLRIDSSQLAVNCQ